MSAIRIFASMDTTNIKYDEEYIVEEYLKGRTQKEIATELGTYNTTIRRILLRNKVEVRPQHIVRQIVKTNPFNGSYDADYFLGYIAADGCIGDKDNRIYLNTNKDKGILVKYAAFVGYGVKVRTSFNKRYNVEEHSVTFANKEVKEYLISLGLTPRKSKTLNYKGEITWEFLRGVFDGDGTVYVTKSGLIRFQIATASPIFAKQVYNFLKDFKPRLNEYKGMHLVNISRQEEIKRLHTKLYQNGSFFFARKERKFRLGRWETSACNTANSGKQ